MSINFKEYRFDFGKYAFESSAYNTRFRNISYDEFFVLANIWVMKSVRLRILKVNYSLEMFVIVKIVFCERFSYTLGIYDDFWS